MSKNKLSIPEPEDEFIKFIDQAIEKIGKGTSFVSAIIPDLPTKLAVSLISFLSQKALNTAWKAFRNMRAKGRRPTHRQKTTLLEFLKFIEEERPQREKFEAMHAIFTKLLNGDLSEQEQIRTYALFQKTKSLDTIDIIVLLGCYDVLMKKSAHYDFDKNINKLPAIWININATELNLQEGVIESSEDNLVKTHLLIPRKNQTTYGQPEEKVSLKNNRLNSTGIELCELIKEYSEDKTITEA